MRSRWTWLALVTPLAFAGGVVAAQDEAPPAAAEDSLEEQIEAVKDRFDEARASFMEAYRAAETREERTRALKELSPDADVYASELLALAEAHAQDPARVEAYEWALQRAKNAALQLRAASALFADFPAREGLGLRLSSLPTTPAALGLMREASKSPHTELAACATYVLGTKLLEQRRHAEALRAAEDEEARRSLEQYLGPEVSIAALAADPVELEREADVLLRKVVDTPEWAAIDYRGRARLGAKAEGVLFELHHLAVGQPVPEIGGEDIGGVAFKLSDYRGKVVFLDFWGHW